MIADDESGSDVEIQPVTPRVSKFKSRKPKGSHKSASQTPARNTVKIKTAFDEEDDKDDNDDIISMKIPLKLKRKAVVIDKPEKNISQTDNSDPKAAGIQNYLSAYGDTAYTAPEKKQIRPKPIVKDIDSDEMIEDLKVKPAHSADAEGFIIEGSDLENDSDEELAKHREAIAKVKEKIRSLDTEAEAQRRKEIEEALSNTNLNDLSGDESSDEPMEDVNGHANAFANKKNKYSMGINFISSQETESLAPANKLATPYTILEPKKGRMVFHYVSLFDEQQQQATKKVDTLRDIITKRELQIGHLKKECEKLETNSREYTKRMNQAFRLSR